MKIEKKNNVVVDRIQVVDGLMDAAARMRDLAERINYGGTTPLTDEEKQTIRMVFLPQVKEMFEEALVRSILAGNAEPIVDVAAFFDGVGNFTN